MVDGDMERAEALLRSPDSDALWASLRADGYQVLIEARERRLVISVLEGEAPCADCLVPPEVIGQVVRGFLARAGMKADALPIDVTLPGPAA